MEKDDNVDLDNDEDEVFWLISPDNIEAKRWLSKINELKRIDINDLNNASKWLLGWSASRCCCI
ncbi:MAG: hypothetical protein ACTSRG_12680 [Candidatus Helarchaeota archaeon]